MAKKNANYRFFDYRQDKISKVARYKYDIEKLDRKKNAGKKDFIEEPRTRLRKKVEVVKSFSIPAVSSFNVKVHRLALWRTNRRSIRTANEIADVPKIEGYSVDVTGVSPNFPTDFSDKLLHIFKKYNTRSSSSQNRKRAINRQSLNYEIVLIFTTSLTILPLMKFTEKKRDTILFSSRYKLIRLNSLSRSRIRME